MSSLPYAENLRRFCMEHAENMMCDPEGIIQYPYLVPGSKFYATTLWDWDSWLANVALRQIGLEQSEFADRLKPYEHGCIQNFAAHTKENGYMPIMIEKDDNVRFIEPNGNQWSNMHKPILAQHAAMVYTSADPLPEACLDKLVLYLNAYETHFRHAETGLFFWQDDLAIGVDNDPCTYFRPRQSSGSILMNSFMYREYLAMGTLYEAVGNMTEGMAWKRRADKLKDIINRHCYDERDGAYYSVDLNLLPINPAHMLHSGAPRHWHCLIMRLDVWSGILPLWAGVAETNQAEAMVQKITDPSTFWANYGVRSLSAKEKMYNLAASNNPSNWLGPVWGVSNYLTWRAMQKYGFENQAAELAEKTVRLLGRDLEHTGTLHEYYHPDTGEGVLTPNFINWNALVLQMLAWLEGRPVAYEF